MVYASLGMMFLTLLLSGLASWKLLNRLMQEHRNEKIQWQAEKERLLNRLMTHSWQDYVQATGSMVVPSSSVSTSDDRGLADDIELQRAGLLDTQGLGEVIVDYGDDHSDLGFIQ